MTEVGWAAMVYLSESKSLSNYKTVGRPVAGTEIKVIDSEGKSLPFNSIGEICIRGDQVSPGYFNNNKENQNIFTSDGFLRTGDTGYYDKDGLFYIVGHYKEMIKVEGILKFKFLHKFFKFKF
jgi:long-subunit acyl-CoA synthetase (AMP-forming)